MEIINQTRTEEADQCLNKHELKAILFAMKSMWWKTSHVHIGMESENTTPAHFNEKQQSRSDCGIPMTDTTILTNSYDNVNWQPKTSPEVENLLTLPHSSILHTMAFCCFLLIFIRLLKVLVKQKITCALMLPLWTVGHTYKRTGIIAQCH